MSTLKQILRHDFESIEDKNRKYDQNNVDNFDSQDHQLLKMLQLAAYKLHPTTYTISNPILEIQKLDSSKNKKTIILRNLLFSLFKKLNQVDDDVTNKLEALDVTKDTPSLFSFTTTQSDVKNDWTLLILYIFNIMKFFYCKDLNTEIFIDFKKSKGIPENITQFPRITSSQVFKMVQTKINQNSDVTCVELYVTIDNNKDSAPLMKFIISKIIDMNDTRFYQILMFNIDDRTILQTQQTRIDNTINFLNGEQDDDDKLKRLDLVQNIIQETYDTVYPLYGDDEDLKYFRAVNKYRQEEEQFAKTIDQFQGTNNLPNIQKTFFWRVIYKEVDSLASHLRAYLLEQTPAPGNPTYIELLQDDNIDDNNNVADDLLDEIADFVTKNKLHLLKNFLCDPAYTGDPHIKENTDMTYYRIFAGIAEFLCGIPILKSKTDEDLLLYHIQKEIQDKKVSWDIKTKTIDVEEDTVEIHIVEYKYSAQSDKFWGLLKNDKFVKNFESYFDKVINALQAYDDLQNYRKHLMEFSLPKTDFDSLTVYLQNGTGNFFQINSFVKNAKSDTDLWTYGKLSYCKEGYPNQYLTRSQYKQKMEKFINNLHLTFQDTFLSALNTKFAEVKPQKFNFKNIFERVNLDAADPKILKDAITAKRSWEINTDLKETDSKNLLRFSQMGNNIQNKDEFFKFLVLSWVSVNRMIQFVHQACTLYQNNATLFTKKLFTSIQQSTQEAIQRISLKRKQTTDLNKYDEDVQPLNKKQQIDDDPWSQMQVDQSIMIGSLITMSKEMEKLKIEVRR